MHNSQTVKYCLPIISKETSVVTQTIRQQLDHYSYFEVWLDYIEDFELEWFDNLLAHYGQRVVVLFRRKQLEPIQLALPIRYELIKIIAEHGAILDLDVSIQSSELLYLKQQKILPTLLLSYHNYDETPSDHELRFILTEMKSAGAWCRKIATQCHSKSDALRLLALQQEIVAEGGASIILGMGQEGVITRLFGTLWGNEMCFAPLTLVEQTAVGQYTRMQYEAIFGLVKNK